MTHLRRARKCSGITNVEVALSAAIVGMLMVVALNAAGGATRSQLANGDSSRAVLIASGLMSEILELPFEDPNATPVFGPESGETSTNRALFDDVDDYHNWSSAPQKKDGTALANASGLTTNVQVALADPNNLGDGAWSPTSPNVKRITVNVLRNDKVIGTLSAVVTK